MSRNHDYFRWIVEGADFFQRFQAVHSREPDIEQDDIKTGFANEFEAVFGACGGGGLIAFIFKNSGERLANSGFVVDDEDVGHHFAAGVMVSDATGSSTTKRLPTGLFSSTRIEP